MKQPLWVTTLITILVIAGVGYGVLWPSPTMAPAPATEITRDSPPPVTQSTPTSSPTTTPSSLTAYKTIRATSIANVPARYNYTAEIPKTWEVEIIPEIEAVNLYDPAAEGTTALEKSQIFIRYFEASSFLTLTSVTVLDRQETTIQNRPAVRYTIEKKASEPNFAHQPAWRNQKHVVTDIRVDDKNTSLFYVVAKRPSLSEDVYTHFFNSITLPK